MIVLFKKNSIPIKTLCAWNFDQKKNLKFVLNQSYLKRS